MYNKREDKIDAFGWNNEFTFGNGVKLVADVNYSKATRDELNLENNLQLTPMPQLDSVGVVVRPNGFSQISPGLDYSNPDALFLTNTIYGSGYGKVPQVEDRLKGGKIALTLPAPEALSSWFADIDVGVNYADRRKQKTQAEGNILLGAQGDANVASDLQYRPVNLGFAGIGYIPAWNVPAAVERYMEFNPVTDLDYLIPKSWTVQEKITTAWLRANINTDIGVVGVRGNIGVQMQHVDQSSQSNYFDRSRPVGQEVLPIDGRGGRTRQYRRADAAHRPELGFALLGQLAAGRQQHPAVFQRQDLQRLAAELEPGLHAPAPADAALRRGQAGRTPARGPDARRPGIRRGYRHRQARRQRRQPAAGSVARHRLRPVV